MPQMPVEKFDQEKKYLKSLLEMKVKFLNYAKKKYKWVINFFNI